jgi:hypothetical protein
MTLPKIPLVKNAQRCINASSLLRQVGITMWENTVSPVERATVFVTNVMKVIVSMSTSKKLREIPERAKKWELTLNMSMCFVIKFFSK